MQPHAFILLDTGRYAASLYYRRHISEFIGDMLGVRLHSRQMELYLNAREEDSARRLLGAIPFPIAFHPAPRGSRNKAWPIDHWREIVRRNPAYTFMQLGNTDDEYVRGAIDLRGATTLRVAFALVKSAKVFVGIDSCMAHVASAVGTPGLVVFGPTSRVLWGNDSNVNISENLSCSPCESILGPQPCPYSSKCMTSVTVDRVHDALQEVVKRLPDACAKADPIGSLVSP